MDRTSWCLHCCISNPLCFPDKYQIICAYPPPPLILPWCKYAWHIFYLNLLLSLFFFTFNMSIFLASWHNAVHQLSVVSFLSISDAPYNLTAIWVYLQITSVCLALQIHSALWFSCPADHLLRHTTFQPLLYLSGSNSSRQLLKPPYLSSEV